METTNWVVDHERGLLVNLADDCTLTLDEACAEMNSGLLINAALEARATAAGWCNDGLHVIEHEAETCICGLLRVTQPDLANVHKSSAEARLQVAVDGLKAERALQCDRCAKDVPLTEMGWHSCENKMMPTGEPCEGHPCDASATVYRTLAALDAARDGDKA